MFAECIAVHLGDFQNRFSSVIFDVACACVRASFLSKSVALQVRSDVRPVLELPCVLVSAVFAVFLVHRCASIMFARITDFYRRQHDVVTQHLFLHAQSHRQKLEAGTLRVKVNSCKTEAAVRSMKKTRLIK